MGREVSNETQGENRSDSKANGPDRKGILLVSVLLIASFSMIFVADPSFDLGLNDEEDIGSVSRSGVSGSSYIYGPDVTGTNGKYRLAYSTVGGMNVKLVGWNSAAGYSEPSGDMIIPSTVTYNGNNYTVVEIARSGSTAETGAFYTCTRITSVTIPSTMRSIGDHSFYGCSSIRSVDMGAATSIGVSAFDNCLSLRSLNIPEGVTVIGSNAFNNCNSMTSVSFPSSLRTIEGLAFNRCSSLTSVDLRNVTSIGGMAFYQCTALTSAVIPSTVTSIGAHAFYYCSSIESVFFEGNSLPSSIGTSAFHTSVTGYYSHGVKTSSWWNGTGYVFPESMRGEYYDLTLTPVSGETVFKGFNKAKVPSSTNNYATKLAITQSWVERYVPAGTTLLYSVDNGTTWDRLAGTTVGNDVIGLGTTGFIISYDPNGGTGREVNTVGIGKVVLSNGSGISRANYYLAGWSTTSGGEVEYALGAEYDVQSNTMLYAVWKQYAVTYNVNGATTGTDFVWNGAGPIILNDGSGVLRTNYYLAGWNTMQDGSGTHYNLGAAYSLSGDLTLYAEWKQYTVTYNVNGATSGSNFNQSGYGPLTLDGGSGILRNNYYLAGWNTLPSGLGQHYGLGAAYDLKGNLTLYAEWKQYKVSYNNNTGSGSISEQVGVDVILSGGAAFSKGGYTLTGWNTLANGTGTPYSLGQALTLTGDVVLYAVWSPNNVTVNYHGNGGNGSPASASGPMDSPWTLPSASDYVRPGYTLTGWSLVQNGPVRYTPGQSAVFDYNVTSLFAVWEGNSITVNYNGNGGTGSPSSASGIVGGSWTLPGRSEYVNPGHTLLGWDTSPAGTTIVYSPGESTVFAYGITTVYAVWSGDEMTVTYHGNGGTGPSYSIGNVGNPWTLPTASDYVRPGYVLRGWSLTLDGPIEYTPGQTVAFTSSVTDVYAVWEIDTAIEYSVSVNAGPNGTASADNMSPNGGDTVTVTITPRSGYLIGTMTDNGYDVSGSLVYSGNGVWKYTISTILGDHAINVTFKVDTSAMHTISGNVVPNAGTGEGFTVTLNGKIFFTSTDGAFSFTVQGGFTGFIQVSKDGYVAATYYLNSVTSSITDITVNISIRSYTVTFHADGAQGSWPQSVATDHGYSLPYMPSDPTMEGYSFAGWFDGSGVAFDPASLVYGNMEIFALWDPTYEIIVSLSGTGYGTIQIDIGNGWNDYIGPFTVMEGTMVHIRAITAGGSVFISWSGHVTSADAEISFVAEGDSALNAEFALIPAPGPEPDPPIYKTWLFWLLVVLLILLLIAIALYARERRNRKKNRKDA